ARRRASRAMFNARLMEVTIDVNLPHWQMRGRARKSLKNRDNLPFPGDVAAATRLPDKISTAADRGCDCPAADAKRISSVTFRDENFPRPAELIRWRPSSASSSASDALCFLDSFRLLAVVGIKQLLAQPDRLRRHLDQLVVGDVGERLLQRHLDRRGEPHPPLPRVMAGVGGRFSP